jgi:PAS domain S-box-containing protein
MATTANSVTEADDRELRLKQTLVDAFLENVPDFVYFKDRDGRFVAVSKSKAERHGCKSASELIGKSDADIFSSIFARITREEEERIMETGEPIVEQVSKVVWPDGEVTWAKTTKLPMRGDKGTIIGTIGISKDVTDAKQTEEALEQTRKDLMDASHLAGMAEVATGVLHNVGNVLNSLNVSASVIESGLKQSKVASLGKLTELLRAHTGDLAGFITSDPKGKRVPEFLAALAVQLMDERERLLKEVESLHTNVDHIREIVTMQQTYATMIGVNEPQSPVLLMEDSLRMNSGALARHEVVVERDFQVVPPVMAERGKVLQILVNLIRNAKYALDSCDKDKKILTLRIAPGQAGMARLIVSDNGVGIAPENLPRIFQHGFTTKVHGHGFGLHSSVLAAKEMNGSLTVQSKGVGHGAEFTLELPVSVASAKDREAVA